MKKLVLSALIFFFILPCLGQQITPKTAFLEKWENTMNYTLEVAELMPEALYDYKPTERQRTFKEQLIHIKGNMDWLSTSYFTETEFKREKKPLPETKEETIALLKAAFEATSEIIKNSADKDLETTVEFFAGDKSKLQILNLLQDHVTHHRGQILVYLNLNEIVPPRYSGW